MNLESKVDKLIARKQSVKKPWFKSRYIKILCIFLIGIFITMVVIVPAITNKSGFTILQERLVNSDYDSGDVLADEPFGNTSDLGWEFLKDGEVIHAWNKHNDYYFNVSNGIQFSNHYEEYWTKNILMLGYYDGDEWNLLYRTDELSGFNRDFEGETDKFMNLTLWKDLSYASYDFRLAIRYNLGVNDSDLTIVPYIKNLGIAIPFQIGFGWEMKDIRIANVTNDNIVRLFNSIDFEDIPLNQTLDRSFTDMDFNTSINLICTNPPSPYLSRNLYLRWNHTLNYKVTVKSRANQYNAPTTLFIKVGTLDVGQEKYTEMNWLDADDWLGISSAEYDDHCGEDVGYTLADALDGTDEWRHVAHDGNVHWFILDLGQTYTIKKVRGRSDDSWDPTDVDIYVSDSKVDWGAAVATAADYQDTSAWVETDTTDKDGRYIKIVINSCEIASRIGWGDTPPASFTIFDAYGDVTGPPANNAPTITGEIPVNSSTVARWPQINFTVADSDGDGMYINISENTTGSWRHQQYNASSDGNIIWENYTNASAYSTEYWWRVNVTDGQGGYINASYRFFTEAAPPANANPILSSESPTNESIDVALPVTLQITCTDANGDTMIANWSSNSSGTWIIFATNASIASGTVIRQNNSNFSSINTTYYWRVELCDGQGGWDNETYHFTSVTTTGDDIVYSSVSRGYSLAMALALGMIFLVLGMIIPINLFRKRRNQQR